jgi:hypothetical protein
MGESKRVRRPGVVITSFLLLAAQILSLGHLLFVRHATCPEHGDVMHPEQSHAAILEGLGVSEALPVRLTTTGAVPVAVSGHDHCLLCTLTHERFALLPPTRASAKPFEVALVRAVRVAAIPLTTVAVISFSPKNSPPSA